MKTVLTVIQAFGAHDVGDQIADEVEIEAVLESNHASYVVRTAVPDEPAAE